MISVKTRVVGLERVAMQTDPSQSLVYPHCISSITTCTFFFLNIKTALKSGFISNQCCLMIIIGDNFFSVLVVHKVVV